MARGSSGVGITLGILSSAAVSILVLGIVFMLAPTIGGRMEEAMPALGATSEIGLSSGFLFEKEGHCLLNAYGMPHITLTCSPVPPFGSSSVRS